MIDSVCRFIRSSLFHYGTHQPHTYRVSMTRFVVLVEAVSRGKSIIYSHTYDVCIV